MTASKDQNLTKAEEHRRFAQLATNQHDRLLYLDIARGYQALAESDQMIASLRMTDRNTQHL
jgi:hypothetical protein